MEVNFNRNLILIVIKYGPWIIGLAYFIQIILACFGIQSIILTLLFSLSIIPCILLLLFSKLFGFCIWNRLPLYYTMLVNVLNLLDYYWLMLPNKLALCIYLILLGIFVLIGGWIKNKNNVDKRNIEENTT